MSENKKKVTIGYKKLKNVDSFDQFDINKEELQGGVNESASHFFTDLDNVWEDLNILSLLWDEGYLNDNATLKVDVADVLDFLKGELSLELNEPWQTAADFDKWVKDVMQGVRDFGEKY